MGLGHLVVGFLQRIAVGAGAVFALLLFIRLRMPSRPAVVNRQTAN